MFGKSQTWLFAGPMKKPEKPEKPVEPEKPEESSI